MAAAAPTLDDLRTWVRETSAESDPVVESRLAEGLAAALAAVTRRCYARYVDPADADFTEYPDELHTAVLILAHRLALRGASPHGVAGFDGTGNVFRLLTTDPDVKGLAGPYLDLTQVFA